MIFLIHIGEKKMLLQEMIFLIRGPMISFFNSHKWRKNDIIHVWFYKWFILFTNVKKKNDIVDLQIHKWFLGFTQKEKNDIAHLWAHKWSFNSHMWRKKWCCTFVGPQVIFLIHRDEENKWYCIFVAPLVIFWIHKCERKNDIAHLQAHKWFLDSH